ncbi:hypothetical protein Godav_024249 [Gossypium davidsonii]|uniref:Mitochondrial substrate carrier family protein n=2 Tax=Gossypium TaxID=3633 RepID=A0A7J8SV98_GOSDV|nr:hypothetical protein [Gossypium davidsonii]MBA0665410.1 hypothetical protein [Gossypium klotzschianum]
MQTEARVGVVNSSHGGGGTNGGVETTSLKFKQQQQELLQAQKTQIGTVSQLLAGGVAGALSKTCTAPLARLTILFQVQGMHSDAATLRKASIWREASRIVGEEGFRAFWKGNLVTIAHRLPYSSLNFYAYEQYKKLLYMLPGSENHGKSMSADICIHFVAGGLAGITAASATYPLDLVRTRLAAQTNDTYYRGIWHALRTICKDEGVLGLYKGLGTTLLGVGPSIAISFSVYESLRSFWQSRRPHDSTVLVSLTCGSLSGIASSTGELILLPQDISVREVSSLRYASRLGLVDRTPRDVAAIFPLDLIRRRKQLEGAGGRARVYKTGLFGTFKHIFQTEGFRGLYRGILPEYYKVVPGVGICFMTYETLKTLLADVTTKL